MIMLYAIQHAKRNAIYDANDPWAPRPCYGLGFIIPLALVARDAKLEHWLIITASTVHGTTAGYPYLPTFNSLTLTFGFPSAGALA